MCVSAWEGENVFYNPNQADKIYLNFWRVKYMLPFFCICFA